ncbi:methylated-DNA--[protein]-cysteine S-methyltransferase, partial [Clostridium sp.]
MAIFFYETKIGKIGIEEREGFINKVYFDNDMSYKKEEVFETELIKEASIQLKEYLNGTRKSFKLPLKPMGTEFMEEAWSELCKIPYGETLSYKELAEKIGRPKSARAIGMACNKNPIP